MDFEKVIIRVTKGEIEEFKKSLLAKDMRREILVLKRMAESEYADANTLLWKGNIDGRIEAIDRILELPDKFISELEQDIEDKKLKEKEDGRNETD